MFALAFAVDAEIPALILAVITVLHYYVNYISCFVLFIKKIVIIINYKMDNYTPNTTSTPSNMDTMDTMDTTNDVELVGTNESDNISPSNKADDNKVIEVTTIDALIRYTLVVFIGFVSTLVAMMNGMTQLNQEEESTGLAELVLITDSLVNILCIYLLFGFGEKLYYKLCGCCDRGLKNCFVKRVLSKRSGNDGDDALTQLTAQESKTLLFKTI